MFNEIKSHCRLLISTQTCSLAMYPANTERWHNVPNLLTTFNQHSQKVAITTLCGEGLL